MFIQDGLLMYVVYSRDVFWKGTCDSGCKRLTNLIGWEVGLYTDL